MIKNVAVKDIKPNPFQHRSVMNKETILQFAKEIEDVGLWAGALRGREKNGSIELCFGHRRLEAIKHLKWPTVDVDVIELDDEQMITQSLIENLQREGLNDVDKSDGIRALFNHISKIDPKLPQARLVSQIAQSIGFSERRIGEWLQLSDFKESEKKLLRTGQISGKTALAADRLGGSEMVHAAVAEELSLHAIEEINSELNSIQSPSIKEKVRAKVLRGKLKTAQAVKEDARKIKARGTKDQPPDLIVFVSMWTDSFEKWTLKLNEVEPYIEYIDRVPAIAKKFREAVRQLIRALEKFV